MIKIYDDKSKYLRTKCTPFDMPLDQETIDLGHEMVEYLKLSQDDNYAKKHKIRSGVGLAAPQIGLTKRLFAVYVEVEDGLKQYALVNPIIKRTSAKKCYLQGGEGCLSVPKDHPGYVYRYNKVVMSGFDILTMKEVEITAYGYFAIVLQHEYDHLDATLYYDRIDKRDPHKEDPNAIAI